MRLDAGPDIGIAERRRHHQVYRSAQKLTKLPPQVAIGFEGVDVRARIELDQEINIAARRVEIVPQGRTEHFQAAHVEAPTQGRDLLAVGFEHEWHGCSPKKPHVRPSYPSAHARRLSPAARRR